MGSLATPSDPAGTSGELPALSVILVTDTYARVDVAIESWRGQTIAGAIELVLITVDADALRSQTNSIAGFHSIQVVQTPSIDSLSPARAAGVRHATAPFVFIAETHAFPEASLAEALVRELKEGYDIAVPGFINANPETALGRSGFLGDYGAWLQDLPPGEIERTPSYNAAFRKSILLEFGDRLEHAITFGDELYLGLRARGHRACFHPAVAIRHVNLCRLKPWLHERFLAGALIGGYRSARWPWWRRTAYAAASPLIALVILSRIQKGVRRQARHEPGPALTILAIVLGAFVKAAGEFRGYVAGMDKEADHIMTRYEIRKLSVNAGDGS